MIVIRSTLLSLLLILSCLRVQAAAPDLHPRDVRLKLKEMMRYHATSKKIDKPIAQRSLENFVNQLDPARTYLTEEEVADYLNPSPDLVAQAVRSFEKDSYGPYEVMYARMVDAIERRRKIEQKLVSAELPQDVDVQEFAEPTWAANSDELYTKLLRLKGLQLETSNKIEPEAPELVFERLAKRRARLETSLLGSSPEEQKKVVLTTILKATANALDAQTAYFTPEEAADFVNELQRRLYGIGVQLRDNLNGFTVVRIIEGGPADNQGCLKVGDAIVAVDDESVIGLDILDAVQHIRGPENSSVKLTILRDGDRLVEQITRGEVVVQESRFEANAVETRGGPVGHVSLHSFYQDATSSSAEDVGGAIAELLQNHELKGLILDLRHNSGGLITQAIDVTSLFIRKGIVCSVKDSDGAVRHLRTFDEEVTWEGPLVVLVSQGSASASEIVSGALQDYGRAIVVGDETTYGKGTFQTSSMDTLSGRYVNPKGEYKVTRGVYYTVSGKSPQIDGVISDIVVPGPLSKLEIGERHVKFPLKADRIKENFVDDLADIPFHHRIEAMLTYRNNLQEKTSLYSCHLPALRQLSSMRTASNQPYQDFLAFIDGEEIEIEEIDFQLNEACNIMGDLIFLLNQPTSAAAA